MKTLLPTTGYASMSLAEDSYKLRELALRFLEGDIDSQELSDLDEDKAIEVGHMIQHLASLRNSDAVKRLRRANPYYSSSPSKIIRG